MADCRRALNSGAALGWAVLLLACYVTLTLPAVSHERKLTAGECKKEDHCQKAHHEVEVALRAHMARLYADRCRGLAGPSFELRIDSVHVHDDTAAVSYTLIVFESCEEGAPYESIQAQENWVRTGDSWRPVE
jgi:hypothetical protein